MKLTYWRGRKSRSKLILSKKLMVSTNYTTLLNWLFFVSENKVNSYLKTHKISEQQEYHNQHISKPINNILLFQWLEILTWKPTRLLPTPQQGVQEINLLVARLKLYQQEINFSFWITNDMESLTELNKYLLILQNN